MPYVGLPEVSGLVFWAARGDRFFFRGGRFLGADSLVFVDDLVLVDPEDLVLVEALVLVDPEDLVLVDPEDSGPKPKNAPGTERVPVFFDAGLAALRCFSRCWLLFLPERRIRDLRREVICFEVSAPNQSFPGQTTGILYPSISSKGSKW